MRKQLKEAYLDYVNNYLTVAVWAEHNDLPLAEAHTLIDMGRRLHEQDVAEGFRV